MNSKERILRHAIVAGLLTSCNIGGVEPTPTPTKTPRPTQTIRPVETPTIETERHDFMKEIFYPALQEVVSQRRQAKENQPEAARRIDWELSQGRVNFLLMGLGSEAGVGEKGFLTDSIHLISIDIDENNLDVLTFNRDIEAPEVQRFRGGGVPLRLNAAYEFGGFPLTEAVIEDATGLAVDFQVVMGMEVLSDFVKQVLDDELEVCLPWEIEDPIGYFPAGNQTLSAEQILSVSRARQYASNYERNQIQQVVIRSILSEVKQRLNQDPLSAAVTMGQLLIFLETQELAGNLETNFDTGFFISLGREVITKLWEQRGASGFGFDLPNFDQRFVFGPPSGLIETGGDPEDPNRQAVAGGNPAATDLIADYWGPVRQKSAQVLQNLEPPAATAPAGEICQP